MEVTLQSLTEKYKRLLPQLNERVRRLTAASDAQALGRGGVTLVHRASGLSRVTIYQGIQDLDEEPPSNGRVRRAGGGRKPLLSQDLTLLTDLRELVEPMTLGDPMTLLTYVSSSVMHITDALRAKGHTVSHMTVWNLLKYEDFSLQSNKKTMEGKEFPDRDRQFQYINDTAKRFIDGGEPVISIDTKKKELIGEYKHAGREWRPKGKPRHVKSHDFGDRDDQGNVKKAIPYGIYDVANNEGYVTVGITHDTAEFAAQGIKNWWSERGSARYPNAKELLITPDAGGSNGYRVRLWKQVLQDFADETRLKITVCHFPSGTSKWNKIEHRMFSFITKNWNGKPLTSYRVAVSLIAATTTKTGLQIFSKLDTMEYETHKQVSDETMASLKIEPHRFHPELNYTIVPRATRRGKA